LHSWIAGILCVHGVLGISGCGNSDAKPLSVGADGITTLDPHVPFSLPANTKLKAMTRCVVSFPGADLLEEGDVIGEVVVIDDDALIYLAPNNETVAVTLHPGQSMSITKPRTITVDETDASPCRFTVVLPDGA
jgi:hypothetical protein